MTFWAFLGGSGLKLIFLWTAQDLFFLNNYLVHFTKYRYPQSANSWNIISLLRFENKILKDHNANKQRFTEIVDICYESNIQSRHNKNTSSTIIHKSTNAGSNNTVLETKVKQRIKSTVLIKDGKHILENQFSLAKWLSFRCYWRFHNKNLKTREISTVNSVKRRSNPGTTTVDLLDHVKPFIRVPMTKNRISIQKMIKSL